MHFCSEARRPPTGFSSSAQLAVVRPAARDFVSGGVAQNEGGQWGTANGSRAGARLAEPIYLIVNADDYGYFPCVSRGILAAARQGAVTATGILANAPFLDEQLGWLRSAPSLDVGVHLNLTRGTPITDGMRHRLRRSRGQFVRKEQMAAALLTGQLTVADVRAEWQSQIEACLAHGLRPQFLNSHEHVHMLPPLFRLIHELARQYAIEHVRYPSAEIPQRCTAGAIVRNLTIGGLGWLNRRRRCHGAILCLGVGPSGRLSFDYLQRLVARLKPGRVYELMCHPGFYDAAEISDSRLRSYHDWEQELAVLTSDDTHGLFANRRVRCVGYRDFSINREASPSAPKSSSHD
jgi:chitin disaccharide deacetylase